MRRGIARLGRPGASAVSGVPGGSPLARTALHTQKSDGQILRVARIIVVEN